MDRKQDFNMNDFSELTPYVQNKNITDIRWDGQSLWIDDLEKGKTKLPDVKLSDEFLNIFMARLSDFANVNFNKSNPKVEAETQNLRITAVHPSVTATGLTFTIRKTEPERRLNEQKMLDSHYCNQKILDMLEAFVKGRFSIIVTGDVGSGKTELIKFMTKFIPNELTTITVEDNFEIRCRAINPDMDCVEIKVNDNFTYTDAIKASLRQNTKWLLMAEARSREVLNLLEAASTGCSVMTTIHSSDVRNIPDRIVQMLGADGEEKRNDVFTFFDVGIMISKDSDETGISRNISQICLFERSFENNDKNEVIMLYDNGEFTGNQIPEHLQRKIKKGHGIVPEIPRGGVNA